MAMLMESMVDCEWRNTVHSIRAQIKSDRKEEDQPE